MSNESKPEPIWLPDPAAARDSAIGRFGRSVSERHGVECTSYQDLWRWSVEQLDQFWGAVWDFFDVHADGRGTTVLAADVMPGAHWFPAARLNYAEHVLRKGDDDLVAVTSVREDGAGETTIWAQLRAEVGALARWLGEAGVRPGDRVVGYLPNTTPALVAFLATVSIGAIWSACAQDYSAQGAAARFAQLDPVVLFAADGYLWNGRPHDRRAEVAALQSALPTVRATVHVANLDGANGPSSADTSSHHGGRNLDWQEATRTPARARFERVDFDAPLWVLFSSGTTGLPKGIVHGHGGVLLEHFKMLGLHMGVGPARPLFWYTNTSWMMWNIVVSGLVGAPTILYDGSPNHPDPQRLWQISAEHSAAFLGVSPGYLVASAKAGLTPGLDLDLSALRTRGATGAPVSEASYRWVHDQVRPDVQLAASSGGTDVVGGFAGSARTTPIWPGEMSAPLLGVALQAWDQQGRDLIGEVGELVITRPMPSMPLYLWDDPDGVKYRDAYFSTFPACGGTVTGCA